jgi:cytochrome P450
LVADALGQEIVPKGTQVIILNGFNHRDDETHESADSFRPERWQEHSVDYHFNHFSNGTQVCAGKTLALFIAKAVLVNLLRESHLKLLSPATLHPQLPLPHTYNYYNIAIQKMAPVHGAET